MIILPWPPSVNRYWRTFRGRMLISAEGRAYRSAVLGIMLPMKLTPLKVPLAVQINANQPDKRRRDLDNICKAALDGLKAGRAYEDDSLIHELHLRWTTDGDPGTLRIDIRYIKPGMPA